MQLMTFNSLLMFDIVFVFFLFLVGVTCLVYYLPPSRNTSTNIGSCRHMHHSYLLSSYRHHHHHTFGGSSRTKSSSSDYSRNSQVTFFSTKHDDDIEKAAPAAVKCHYVKAKQSDVKKCTGPIQDV